MQTIDEILDEILVKEGGYVNDPVDAGGATNLGVSLRYAKGVPEMDLDGDGDIDKHDIMLVTPAIAKKLYRRDFFFGPGIDEAPAELHAQLFDLSVNAGGNRAIKTLQLALKNLGFNLVADGYMGPVTAGTAVDAIAKYGVKRVNNEVVKERIEFYEAIIRNKPSQARFRNGWTRRARSFLI